jgi:hypothetical protein
LGWVFASSVDYLAGLVSDCKELARLADLRASSRSAAAGAVDGSPAMVTLCS